MAIRGDLAQTSDRLLEAVAANQALELDKLHLSQEARAEKQRGLELEAALAHTSTAADMMRAELDEAGSVQKVPRGDRPHMPHTLGRSHKTVLFCRSLHLHGLSRCCRPGAGRECVRDRRDQGEHPGHKRPAAGDSTAFSLRRISSLCCDWLRIVESFCGGPALALRNRTAES